MMSIVRRIVAFLVFFAFAASANAQSYTYSIYIDADNNAATGCSVSSPGGTLAGIDSALTITATAGATPTVGSVTRSSCSGGALGAPVAEGSGAVSVGAGVGGTTSIELSDALANIAGASSTALHLYVVAQSASGSDVLLNTTGAAGGTAIMLALPVPGVTVPTPLFGIPAILLLGAALLAVGSRAARRRVLKRMLLGLVMVSGIAGAAIFNWNGIAPLASDPAGDSTSGESAIDLRYFFGALQGSNIYFRIDVTGALTTPPVAVADSYSASFNTALTVTAPGVLGNDTLNGATITANANPAHGTLALNANGGFVYTPASGYAGADSFTYTLTNAGGSSTATVSITVATPAAPTVTGVAPANGPTAGGTSVTITGTNFTGATAVKFGATLATSFTVVTATQIIATAPAGSSGTVDVTVTTPGGTSAVSGSDKFAYFGPPASIVVASGTPQSAAVGTAFALPLLVTVKDASSNPVPGATVTFTAPASGASAALSSPAVTNASGQTQVTATANSTSGAYTVIASVSGVVTPANFALTNTASGATHFALSAPATATAGTAFSFTVTAQDQFNNTVTGYSGTVHFTSTDGQAVLPANSTLTNGVGTFSATLKTAGNQTLTATDTVTASITGTSGSIAVSAAAATHFAVSAPASATAGTAFNVTVTAQDQFNNAVTGYSGTAHFTSTDGAATLPANYTFVAGDAGVHVFAGGVTLKTAGNQTLTATDTVTASITGTSGAIAVGGAGATHFALSAPATATAGTAFSFTVTAQDQFNNTVTGYSGTVHFTSTDAQATLPADSTLTNGVGTFSATLKTAGTQTVTATDTVTASITGTSGTIAVNAAAAAHFTVSAPASATAGTAFSFTVTAKDPFNNTVTGYNGTAHFTSTDGAATLPADYTFVAGDAGAHVFAGGATLKTAGSRTLTATDTVSASITGTSGTIVVSAAAATHFTLSAPATATAGTAFSFTVTAQDQFNNTATAYSGTAHFTSTDGAATLPANYAFVAGDAGVHTFVGGATLNTAGNQTLTATDTVTASINGTANTIAVNAAAATHFTVVAPASAAGNTAFNFTVTAQDQFNNVATAYSGTVHFTSSDGAATLPANSLLASGTGTFSATLQTAGNQTISATDTVTASITGTSGTIVVATPPTASNDSYTTVGNTDLVVGATPPSTPYVLGAAGLLSNDTTSGATTVAVTQVPTHGTINLTASSGAFTYTPAAGYTGTDTFKYTVTDGSTLTSAPATVTITVTSRVWYVNGAAATNGSGVSSSPLNTLATIAPSLLAGDTIFVESGGSFTTTGGAISLPAGVTLWGQGTNLPLVAGITILNTTATSKPRLTGTVTLAGSNTTVSSLDINTSGVTGLTNTGTPSGVTIKNNVSVTTSGATAVSFNGVSGTLTLRGVSASVVGAGSGISLTGGTGFSVTGDGVTAGSGGTISGTCTTGLTGCGAVKLGNAGTVSLAFMNLAGATGSGVYATDTTTTVANSSLTNFAVVGIAMNASALASGTFNLHDNSLTGSGGDAIQLQLNASGTWTGHVKNNAIGSGAANPGSLNGDGIGIDVNGSGTATVDVSNNTINQIAKGYGVRSTTSSTNGTLNVSVLNNTVTMAQASGLDAITAGSGSASGGVCLNASGNNATAAGTLAGNFQFDTVGISVVQNTATSVFKIQGYAGAATNDTAVQTYLASINTLSGPGGPSFADHTTALNVNGFGAAVCPTAP